MRESRFPQVRAGEFRWNSSRANTASLLLTEARRLCVRVGFRVGQPSDYGEKGMSMTLGGYAVYSRFRFENELGEKYYAKLGEDFTIENVRLLTPDGSQEVRCDTAAYSL